MTDELTDTLREIIARLGAHGIDYMLVGSIAALAHGHSRSTQDFDLVIEARASQLRALVRELPRDRFYVAEEAAMEALRHESLFNVIDMVTGWKVDLIPRKDRAFSIMEFERRRELEVLGVSMFVATLEDTIIAKLEWAKAGGGSRRQLDDVAALLRLAGDELQREYVEAWIGKLGLADMWAQTKDST